MAVREGVEWKWRCGGMVEVWCWGYDVELLVDEEKEEKEEVERGAGGGGGGGGGRAWGQREAPPPGPAHAVIPDHSPVLATTPRRVEVIVGGSSGCQTTTRLGARENKRCFDRMEKIINFSFCVQSKLIENKNDKEN